MIFIKRLTLIVTGVFLFGLCSAKNLDFVVTIENNVMVYLLPDTNASKVIVLPIGNIIKIVSNSIKIIKIGNQEGFWVYIDTQRYKSIESGPFKGWIPNFYTAQKKDFKKVHKFGSYKLDGTIGDVFLDYMFNKDGTFKQKIYDDNRRIQKTVIGHIYQKGKLIYMAGKWINGEDYFDFFYIDDASNLFTIEHDLSGKPIQAKRLNK